MQMTIFMNNQIQFKKLINQHIRSKNFLLETHFNDLHFAGKDNSETGCSHHGSCNYNSIHGCACTNYATSVQCVAFARYAFDRYNHCEKWNPVDKNSDWSSFNSNTTNISNDFKNLAYGTYVDLLGKNGNSDHTFIFISWSSTGIKVYDANWDGKCGVQYHDIKYSDMKDMYSRINYTIAHKLTKFSYDKTTGYDYTKYHKAACSTSGCKGYKLVAHTLNYSNITKDTHKETCKLCGYSATVSHTGKTASDGVTKCSGCGYVMAIQGGVASTGDEVASAGNEIVSANNEIASVNNETASVGDEIATSDDETTVADEETMLPNEETTLPDEETTVADEETTVANEETTVADDENTTTDDIAS